MGLDQSIHTGKNEEDETLATFRKVNSLHGWVEHNLNDGKSTNVEYIKMTHDDLEKLSQDIKDAVYNGGVGMEPKDGFFFGSTDKDEMYYKDLGDLSSKIEEIQTTMRDDGLKHVYYYSWW